MIGIVPDPRNRVVPDQLVDPVRDGSAVSNGASRKILTVRRIIGHHADKVIPDEGHVVAYGRRAVRTADDQRGDDIAFGGEDRPQINEVLLVVFPEALFRPRGFERFIRSVNDGMGDPPCLAAFSGAIEINRRPHAETAENRHEHQDLEKLVQNPSFLLSSPCLLYNHAVKES